MGRLNAMPAADAIDAKLAINDIERGRKAERRKGNQPFAGRFQTCMRADLRSAPTMKSLRYRNRMT